MILLITLCVSISKITAQQSNDSLKIAPYQVKNVYIGLKQGEEYRIKYFDCLEASYKLDSIVQAQAERAKGFAESQTKLNEILTSKYNHLVKESVDYEKNKPTPWYLHPVTYLIAGFTTAAVIFK